jgi:hypothetical protein
MIVPMMLSAQQNNTDGGVPKFSTEAEKQQWINSHPEEYQNAGGVSIQDSTALKNTPPEFKSSEEKQDWVRRNTSVTASDSAVVKTETVNASDPTFPVLIHTGNPEKDLADYEMRKNKWYEEQQTAQRRAEEEAKIKALREKGIEVEPSNK